MNVHFYEVSGVVIKNNAPIAVNDTAVSLTIAVLRGNSKQRRGARRALKQKTLAVDFYPNRHYLLG
jgi:hypothetical protein